MSTTEKKIPLVRAQYIANRFIAYLQPFVAKISVAGSVRREVEFVGDIEAVCVAKDEFSLGIAFPEGFRGMTTNGSRLKKFYYPESGIHLELYIPQPFDYGRILAIRTGSSGYAHLQLMTQANRLGWIGTVDGLRRKKECEKRGGVWKILPDYKLNPTKPPEFPTEESFFEFLKIPWIDPKERSWIAQQKEYNYSK